MKHGLNHRAPGGGEIGAVVTAAAGGEQAPAAAFIRDAAKPGGGVGMGLGRVAQVRDRIAGERIGAGLQQNELGLAGTYERFDLFPGNKNSVSPASGGNGILSLVPRATPLPVSVAAPVPG